MCASKVVAGASPFQGSCAPTLLFLFNRSELQLRLDVISGLAHWASDKTEQLASLGADRRVKRFETSQLSSHLVHTHEYKITWFSEECSILLHVFGWSLEV